MYFNEHTLIFLDGQWLKAADAKVSLYTQSLHYGVGVFEGIRSYEVDGGGAQIFKAKEHYERLHYSAEKMHIPLDYSIQELCDLTYSLLQKNGLTNAYIRPLLFTGADMSLSPAKETHLMLAAWDWDRFLGHELIDITVSPFERPNPQSCFVDAKVTGHYINSVLASQEARARGFQEGLLLDCRGFVAEGPGANFFFEKGGTLYTPPKGNILPGITRQTVIALARSKGIAVEECFFRPEELHKADGAFFTGTAVEVAGIQTIEGRPFKKEFQDTLGCMLSREYSKLVRCAAKRAAA